MGKKMSETTEKLIWVFNQIPRQVNFVWYQVLNNFLKKMPEVKNVQILISKDGTLG